MRTTTLKGTNVEAADLLNAIENNCACEFAPSRVRLTTCGAHDLLVRDQRVLDRLVFARRIARRLRLEEEMQIASDGSRR